MIQFSLQSVEIKKLEKYPTERTAMNAVKPFTFVLKLSQSTQAQKPVTGAVILHSFTESLLIALTMIISVSQVRHPHATSRPFLCPCQPSR